MKSKICIFITCILIIIFSNCSKQLDNEVEVELQVHFDNFVTEAAHQGMSITLENIDISGYVENIEKRGTLGQCKSYSDGSSQVVIDQSFWYSANDMEREYIVFHELGHCILGRDHKDAKDTNGNCMSIMQSGTGKCVGIYNLQNRNSLLNELFDF